MLYSYLAGCQNTALGKSPHGMSGVAIELDISVEDLTQCGGVHMSLVCVRHGMKILVESPGVRWHLEKHWVPFSG